MLEYDFLPIQLSSTTLFPENKIGKAQDGNMERPALIERDGVARIYLLFKISSVLFIH